MIATEKDDTDDMIKSSMFLACIDQRGREIFQTFTFNSADDEMKLDPFLNKFSATQANVSPFFVQNLSRIDSLKARVFRIFFTELEMLST